VQAVSDLARDPAALGEAFATRVGWSGPRSAVRVVHAPGRVNLIGEHTDYNDGLVLPVAIDLGISIAFVPTEDRRVSLTLAATGESGELDLDADRPADGTWLDYVAGMAWALEEAGATIRGFSGLLASDLPMASGLASSAALELASALALGGGEAPIADPLALARAAQRAENAHVGVPCGLMDQFAVTCGVEGAALLLDCRSFAHEVVSIPEAAALVVCDSGVPRRLAASAYAARRAECERALEQIRRVAPQVRSLRDVDEALLAKVAPELDAVALRRARHVVSEDARVLAAADALRSGDLRPVGRLLVAGHASLRDDFEVSTPELDQLVGIATDVPGVYGSRLTGAGLGGCTVTLVESTAAPALMTRLRADYRTPSGEAPFVARVRPSHGASALSPSLAQ
jgi:galactokinase